MSNPIKDTLLFLTIARDTICEQIERSSLKNKYGLINYIQNEATDLQIISLLTFNEMPDVKYDPDMEEFVWEVFKYQLTESYHVLSENVPEVALDDIIFEMTPVSCLGYSSAKPILEFCHMQGYLSEQNLSFDPKKEKERLRPKTKGEKVGQWLQKNVGGATKSVAGAVEKGTKAAAPYITKAGENIGKVTQDASKKYIEPGTKKVADTLGKVTQDVSKKYIEPGTKKVADTLEKGVKKITPNPPPQKTSTTFAGEEELRKKREAEKRGWLGNLWKAIKDNAESAYEAARKFVQDHPTGSAVAGGLALASIIGYASYKLYKKYMDKAEQACKNAENKSECLDKYREKARQSQIKDLRSGLSACSKTKEPEKCKNAIQKKINKLNS